MLYFDHPSNVTIHDIWAKMVFPKNDNLQNWYVLRVTIEWLAMQSEIDKKYLSNDENGLEKEQNRYCDYLKEVICKHGGMETLRDLVESEQYHQQLRMAFRRGSVAGTIILRMIQLHEAKQRPSLERVIKVLLEEVRSKDYWEIEKDIITSKSKMKESWSQYKSVAHLWAAYNHIISEESNHLDNSKNTKLYTNEIVPYLVAFSEQIFAKAAAIKVVGQKKPFVSKEDVWLFPAEYPRVKDKIRFNELENWVLKLLNAKSKLKHSLNVHFKSQY